MNADRREAFDIRNPGGTIAALSTTVGYEAENITARVIKVFRRFLLAIFLLGSLVTAGELLLLKHTDSFWQWMPLALFGASFAVLLWHGVAPSPFTVWTFKATMWMFIASGLIGLFLHYDGKVEFKLEVDPSLAGWALFKEAMAGAVPPALAPAAMIQFGLIGLALMYRHPALRAAAK